MNEPERIEEALKRLQPDAMPPHLMARLTAARPQATASAWRGVIVRWLLPIAASACVAAGTFFWLESNRRPAGESDTAAAAQSRQRSVPVESEDYLLAARPVGIVVAPDQRPYRIVEVEWLEHQTVRGSEGGPALHTATTRRDVVPVAMQLY